MVIELESVKTRISAPAHPSATGIGRVSGLALESEDMLFIQPLEKKNWSDREECFKSFTLITVVVMEKITDIDKLEDLSG